MKAYRLSRRSLFVGMAAARPLFAPRTTGQTTGSGLPLELTFYPMGVGALCVAVFAAARLCR